MTGAPRVLHVIDSLRASAGGPTVAAYSMLRALARRGLRADLVTTESSSDGSAAPPRTLEIEGQRIHYFRRDTARYGLSAPLWRWLRHSIREYDVVHTTGLFSFAPLAAAWIARAAGVPYVMRLAGTLDTWGMRHKSPLVKRASIALLEGPLLEGAAAVHFMSELERTRAEARGRRLRAVVVPMGFDFSTSPTAPDDRGLEDLELQGAPVVLYLSRIDYMKGVDVLLRAFAKLTPASTAILLIAGDGPPALVASLKALAAELGLGSRVRWLGFVSGARKRALLELATVFTLPSLSENFGVAVVEAMQAGLPVVVTEGAGLAELVTRAGAGRVTDGSVAALHEALAALLADEPYRRRCAEAGRRIVCEELTLEAFGARLERLYRSVLDGQALTDLPPSPHAAL